MGRRPPVADGPQRCDIPDGGATIRHKLAVLARACETVGRDPGDIEVTLSTHLGPDETADAFVDHAHALAGQGIGHLVVLTQGPWTLDRLDVVADVATTVATLPTAGSAMAEG